MVAISRDHRQAACISPNRLESSVARHPVADAAVDCMPAPFGLHWIRRDSVKPPSTPELQRGLIGDAVEGISAT
jgi:hypothetical protein